jgi:hypothetical protein
VVKALCYKPKGRGFETQGGEFILSIDLILLAALGPAVYSASNRSIKLMFLGTRELPVRMADNLAAICEPIV